MLKRPFESGRTGNDKPGHDPEVRKAAMTADYPIADEPLIDDAKPIRERELESELAGRHGALLPGVITMNGERRLANDGDPALNADRDAGVIIRPLRSRAGPLDESCTPIPPPPRRD